MSDLFVSLVAIAQESPKVLGSTVKVDQLPGVTPVVKRTFSAGRRVRGLTKIQAGHILDGSTIALWRMDDSSLSSSLVDETGAHNATVGLSTAATGLISGARQWSNQAFSGANTGLPLSTFTGPFTFETWLNWNEVLPTYPTVIWSMAGDFSNLTPFRMLMTTSVGTNYVYISYDAVSGTIALTAPVGPTNTWFHVAFRKKFNGTNYDLALFYNGVKTSELLAQPESNALAATGTTIIGNQPAPWDSSVGYGGLIDDTRLSSIARSDAEILESYRRGAFGA